MKTNNREGLQCIVIHMKNRNPFWTVYCSSRTKRINAVFGKRKSQEDKGRREADEEQHTESKEKETIAATKGQYNEPQSKISK